MQRRLQTPLRFFTLLSETVNVIEQETPNPSGLRGLARNVSQPPLNLEHLIAPEDEYEQHCQA